MATSKKTTPSAPVNMKRWNVFMPPDYLEGLETLAGRKGTTSADLVRAGVRTLLRRAGLKVT